MTTFEYDDAGRLVRAVSRAEPEWDAEQVGVLVASREREAELGPEGFPMSVAMDPANQFRFEIPQAPLVNFAAQAVAKGQKAYYDKYDTDPKNPMDRSGHFWVTRLKD